MSATDAKPVQHGSPARRAPERRRPLHIAVAVGASTGLYAVALLGVTRLQIATDQALIAERDPALRAIELLGDHHDRMSADLDAARRAYTDGAGRFTALAEGLPLVADDIARLDATLAAIEAELARMPGNFDVPKVRPRTAGSGSGGTSTGGSGGSGGSGSSDGVTVPPPPPAATPPPTQGTTGGSGAP